METKKADAFIDEGELIRVRLLRHATLILKVAGKTILVDPMLSAKEMLDPVPNASNSNRIPLVDLPVSSTELAKILETTDLVLVTHMHRDHWDIAAQNSIDKNKTILCQPEDVEKIRDQGFTNVWEMDHFADWKGISFKRTHGQHGTGEIGKQMGVVSGVIITNKNNRLYITGDTIWCKDVRDAINKYQPTHLIANGGGARFLTGDPITMTIDDVVQLSSYTDAPIDVVHLDTVNHCHQLRSDFRSEINKLSLGDRIRIPNDGDWIAVGSRHEIV